jgi:hypothetical protein
MLKTNKKLSARRHMIAAIEHLHKKDYECAITLAGAAEDLIEVVVRFWRDFFRLYRPSTALPVSRHHID